MKQQEFEDTLRQFKHRVPFEPFVIELLDGRVILVDVQPAFDENGGGFLSDIFGLVNFVREEVRAIRMPTPVDLQKVATDIARQLGRTEAGMTQTQFEDTLRQFIRSEPFVPFVVELLNGQRISVTQPTVAFNAGAALYISEMGLARFACEDVREIRQGIQEAVA